MKQSPLCSKLMHLFAACAFAFLPALMVSCGSGSSGDSAQWLDKCSVVASRTVVNGDTVIACDFSAVKESVRIPFSMWVDQLEIVKLDNSNEEALIGSAFQVDVSDNYIGINVSKYPYRLFTRQGKFVASIGGVGQGPGEYNILGDCQVDEAHNRVYLLPWATKQILVYDLQGNFIGNIPLSYFLSKGQLYVDYDRQRVTVVQLSLKNRNFFNGASPSPPVWIQDMEGNVIHENRAPQLALSGGYGNFVSLCEKRANHYTFSIFRSVPDVPDSLYTYWPDSNRLSPQFTVDFGDEMKHHAYLDYGDYYLIYIWGPNPDSTTMHLFTAVVVKRMLVDKRTLRGAFYKLENDYLGGIPLHKRNHWWAWMEYGYAACWDPGDLLDLIEERLADPEIPEGDREFLNVWKSKISPDDNSYVILGKWKNGS